MESEVQGALGRQHLPSSKHLLTEQPGCTCSTRCRTLLSRHAGASVGRTSTSSLQSSRKMVPKGPLARTIRLLQAMPHTSYPPFLISIVPEKMAAVPNLNLSKRA